MVAAPAMKRSVSRAGMPKLPMIRVPEPPLPPRREPLWAAAAPSKQRQVGHGRDLSIARLRRW